MMGTIARVNCSGCGSIELTVENVTRLTPEYSALSLFGKPIRFKEGYRFDCPSCGLTQVCDSSPQVDAILEALQCPTAPGGVITEDEITQFVEGLK